MLLFMRIICRADSLRVSQDRLRSRVRLAEAVNETIYGRDTKGADGIVREEQINSLGTGGNDRNDKRKQADRSL